MTYSLGKVSIVIPCFNHGHFLPETLESVEKVRDSRVAEVIIVDDGSTDEDTCELIKNLDRDRYKIVRQNNQGLSRARNAGIEIAVGEFILPLDSDNLIRMAYFDRGVALLNQNPQLGVVYGDANYFGERAGRRRVARFNLRSLVRRNYIDACALYRKSVWKSVQGYDEKMRLGWEDWDYWMRVALQGWKFKHLSEIAYDYRVHQGSMICETFQHVPELIAYIFGKPENSVLKTLRDREAGRIAMLSRVEMLSGNKIGRWIVAPLRVIKRRLAGSC